jgi:hypothetical protein
LAESGNASARREPPSIEQTRRASAHIDHVLFRPFTPATLVPKRVPHIAQTLRVMALTAPITPRRHEGTERTEGIEPRMDTRRHTDDDRDCDESDNPYQCSSVSIRCFCSKSLLRVSVSPW